MRPIICAAVASIGLAFLAGRAEAMPVAPMSGVAPTNVEQAQFFFGGRDYCWYDDGWQGPGFYWCGYAWRRGFGWGGGAGWHGWGRGGRGGHVGRGGHMGGPGVVGRPAGRMMGGAPGGGHMMTRGAGGMGRGGGGGHGGGGRGGGHGGGGHGGSHH
jgi:hypothetical protein